MKRLFYGLTFCLLAFVIDVNAQDFSNKGKDFWVGYGLHSRMFQNTTGGTQDMVLYFATESVTSITVSAPGVNYSQTYANIPANTIFTTNALPKNGLQDARLIQEGISSKGIHITSDKPVVAYAHIYNNNVSGATLLFPTNTLGKEYYSINFEQHSNEANSNSFIYAIAADTGTTTIEVIPSENTQNMNAGQVYTYNLLQGQVFNALGVLTGSNDGVDLTGTKIRSISTASGGCKRIAVFSGSGKINIKCPLGTSGGASADNYMVQAFPKNAWGKYYLTVPTSQMPSNFFRVAVQDPTTLVKLNGVVLTGLINGFYYQIGQNNMPNVIEADKPVMVAQYITSASQCGNSALGGDGDPEVIYLSPVEQNIDKVILNSTSNFAITRHYINVVIPNKGTAVSSFKIDGVTPSSSFVVHPQNSSFSYLIQSLSAGQHTIQSDSGFNAIAYGYGGAESYGYNAGANVKDLYQFVSIQNQYATVNFPSTCRNTPFFFSMTFPYQPTQIKWVFGTALNTMGIADVVINPQTFDSTWLVNGKQLYRYKLANSYLINAVGTYPIKVVAQNPTSDGCSGEQEINYDVQVFEPPVADFNFSTSGCVSDSVRFTDNSSTFTRASIKWFWNFADGKSSQIRNPAHLYNTPGSVNVKFAVVTDIGCLSDTATKQVVITEPPVANFGVSSPACIGKTITFTDSSVVLISAIVKWTWNYGDGTPVVVVGTKAPQTHIYASAGAYTVSLQVENASGCKSVLYSRLITISPGPKANFIFEKVCLPAGTMQFTDLSVIADGTQNSFGYAWNFGDGAISTAKTPSHNYSAIGPYSVSLVVTSGAGCTDSVVKVVDSIYAQPQANFTSPAEVCFGTTVKFTDQSTAPNSSTTGRVWDFGDGTGPSTQQNPAHDYTLPGAYAVTLTTTSAVGCVSVKTTKSVVVNALPTADFVPSIPSCVSKTITFTNSSSANSGLLTKWTWNFGDGSPASNLQSPTHTYLAAGSYDVTLQVETDKGCISNIKSKPVVVSPLPVLGFIMPGNCINDPISQFFDTSSIADGSQTSFSYLWNFGDANASAGNLNTSSVQNASHKFTATGNYNVSLTITSNNGCSSNITQMFTINGAVPVPAFTIQGGLQYCSNDSLTITDNSSVNPGKLVKLEIYWDFTGDPTNKTVITNPIPSASYSHLYPEFFTPATKNYVVNMVAYSGINCLSSLQQIVTLNAAPDIVFNAIAPICSNKPSFPIPVSVNNMLGGTGIFSGTGVTGSGLFNPSTVIGSSLVRYNYMAPNGCSNFKEQIVRVNAVPKVSAGPDKFILEGGSAILNGSSSGNSLTFLWSPGTYLNNPGIRQPTSIPLADINYTLTVISAEGCSDSDQVFVKLLKTPTIPNVFTPNGDGVNDTWVIEYLESYVGATVEIFNRYGSLVFRSVGYTKSWDGTYGGKQMPAGTYYYIINPKNGRKQISGFVDIVR